MKDPRVPVSIAHTPEQLRALLGERAALDRAALDRAALNRAALGQEGAVHRRSPVGEAEARSQRGDHSLDPSLYEPDQPLRDAAVMVPIVLREAEPTLLLTRRTDHLNRHAGQISFPGGGVDPGDADSTAAALRETREEIGLAAEQIEIVGQLDHYLVRSGFLVVPLVGLVQPPFDLTLNPSEVAEVFEVPLSFFLTPGRKERHSRMFLGKKRPFYAYPYGEYYIWGATAGMIANLSEVLRPELAET